MTTLTMITKFVALVVAAPFVVAWMLATRNTHRADEIGQAWARWISPEPKAHRIVTVEGEIEVCADCPRNTYGQLVAWDQAHPYAAYQSGRMSRREWGDAMIREATHGRIL